MTGGTSPELVAGPRREGTGVTNFSTPQLLLEGGDGQPDDFHIGLFSIALMIPGGELLGDEHMLALACEAIGDPHPGQLSHTAGDKTSLLAQLAAGQHLGVDVVRFPTALRQLERSLPDSVAELLDQPDVIAVDG
jgi:hypothetical protein